MPEMDGLEVTRYIMSERKQESISSQDNPLLNVNDVYIIALTASASRQDRQICIDAGMNDFISKPFTLMEMTAALKNCASKRKKRKKQQIREEECSKQHEHQQHELQDYPMIYVDNDRKSNNRSRSNSVEVESVDDPMSTSLENTPTASSAGFFQL